MSSPASSPSVSTPKRLRAKRRIDGEEIRLTPQLIADFEAVHPGSAVVLFDMWRVARAKADERHRLLAWYEHVRTIVTFVLGFGTTIVFGLLGAMCIEREERALLVLVMGVYGLTFLRVFVPRR